MQSGVGLALTLINFNPVFRVAAPQNGNSWHSADCPGDNFFRHFYSLIQPLFLAQGSDVVLTIGHWVS